MREVPEIRFKGYTDAWVQRKLGEVGSVEMCRRIFKEETDPKGDIPFYKIGTFGTVADAYISREKFEEYKSKYPYPKVGDILISAAGSIGRIVEYKGEEAYFQDSNIVWLNHGNEITGSFLKQFYSMVVWGGIEGSTIQRLYNKTILETELCLPSLEEQTAVGNFFRTLDDAITLHQRKLDGLRELKRGYLQLMFPQAGERVPRVRFAGFSGEWVERKLGEVAKYTTGGGTPNTSNEEFWRGDIPWLQSSDMAEHDLFGISARKRITEKGLNNSAAKLVQSNSIAIVTRVGVGKLAIVPFDYATSQDFLSLSALNIDTQFGAYSIYRRIQKDSNQVQGTSIKGITNDELLNKAISVPTSGSEQTAIGNFFRNLDKRITAQAAKLEQIKQLKAAYLQKMFI